MLPIPHRLSSLIRLTALALVALAVPHAAQAADASVGTAMQNAHFQFGHLIPFIGAVCWIGGLNYSVQALLRAYNYARETEKGIWASGVIQRFMGASLLFALPKVLTVLNGSLFGDDSKGFTQNWSVTDVKGTDGGLDVALVHMVRDIVPALVPIIGLIAFISGVLMIVSGIVALSEQGHQQTKAGKKEIAARFLVGTLLTTFSATVGTMLQTIFSSSTSDAVGTLAYDKAGLTAAQGGQVDAVFNAIFAWLAVIGLIAILRGLWVLKNSLEDGSKGLTAPLTHLIAGAALVNIVPAIHMIQSTLGCGSGTACGVLS